MKNLLCLFLGFSLLLTACSRDEDIPQAENPDSTNMRFYGVVLPKVPGRQGAAQSDRLWNNGDTIKVKFLNGSATLHEKVISVAKEWELYANITFNFVNDGDAPVRVGFDWNENRYVTWSYIGTDCKLLEDQSEATLSFCILDAFIRLNEERFVRGDILRAFGQVLGLELESRNINFIPAWIPRPNRVQAYWEYEISDVMWEELKKYVFDPLDADLAICTESYDELSIMVWPFPKNILVNGGSNGENTELSDTDKEFIARLYPNP